MNYLTDIEPGSTSIGSLRLENIIKGIRFLDTDDELCDLLIEFDNTTDEEDQEWIFDSICDRLNEICPDDLMFAPHENDNSNYGFWSIYE